MSKLDPYKDEILKLRHERETQANIIRYLAREHDLTVSSSALSAFIRQHSPEIPPPGPHEPRVSPEEEHFFAQSAVYGEIQGGILELREQMGQMRAAMADILQGLGEQEREIQRRDEDLLNRLNKLEAGGIGASSSATSSAQAAAPNPAPSPAVLRKIWKQALVITGIGWLSLWLTFRYLFG